MAESVIPLTKVGKAENLKRESPNTKKYTEVRSREHLLLKEVEAMQQAIKKVGGCHAHRDATLILLIYRHGFRVAEVAVLRWEQIDFSVDKIERNHAGSSTKLRSRIERLAEEGHELRRPTADYLRDKIYELRANYEYQAYRLLYFFHQEQAVLCLGCIKNEDPAKEFDKVINQAVEKRSLYVQDPNQYTYLE